MTDLINFRDFGAGQTGSLGSVRVDRLYRSGHFGDVRHHDRDKLLLLDFGFVADLRYPDERMTDRSPWPDHWASRIFTQDGSGEAAPHNSLFDAAMVGPRAIDESYQAFYRSLPFDPPFRQLFSRTFREIGDREGRVLIHCSAGKDRTGVLSALILHILGVDRQAIIADYLKSSSAPALLALKSGLIARSRADGRLLTDAAADGLLGVKAEYLLSALEGIEARSGTIEAWLAMSGVGPDALARLRRRLLEP